MSGMNVFAFLALLVTLSGTVKAGEATLPGKVTSPYPTINNLALEWEIEGDDNANATCEARYRPVGTQPWHSAMPLVRVPAGVSQGTNPGFSWTNRLSGSILDLKADTEYEIELRLNDPDGGSVSKPLRARTRPEPVAPEGAPTRRVGKADLHSARPGEILLLDDGDYGEVYLNGDGEPGRPIVYRSPTGKAVFKEIGLTGRKWVYLEGVTVNGPIRLNGASNCVVRRCAIRAQFGIKAYKPGMENCCIEDNVVIGIQPWKTEIMGASGDNEGEGIQITGSGNVIRHNFVSGFRDCLSHLEDQGAVVQMCNDWLNNDVRAGLDDGIEADFALSNCRVMRNRFTNCFVGISSQPGLGGPNYFIRNAMYNLILYPFKLHRGSQGDVILHNTAVKVGDGFGVYSGVPFDHALIQNNLFIGGRSPIVQFNHYSPGRGRAADLQRFGEHCQIDHNAYAVHGLPFEGKIGDWTFHDLPGKGTRYESHGLRVGLDALAIPTFPDDPLREYDPPDLRPREGGSLVDRALVIPNVNDAFQGNGPDLGAYEAGEPLPLYGPRPRN